MSVLWEVLKSQPLTLFLPWLLGGYILAAVTVPSVYPVYFFLVKAGKKARRKTLAIRTEERRAKRDKKRMEIAQGKRR
jgi:hypothetical protein